MYNASVKECPTLPFLLEERRKQQTLQIIFEKYDQLPEKLKNPIILLKLREVLETHLPPALVNIRSSNKFPQNIEESTYIILRYGEILRTGKFGEKEKRQVLQKMINEIPIELMKRKAEKICGPYINLQKNCMVADDVRKLIGQLLELRNIMAETFLKNVAFTSFLIILCQYMKLMCVWNKVSGCTNILASSKYILVELRRNVSTIETSGILELIKLHELYEKTKSNEEHIKISRKMNEKSIHTNMLFVKIRTMIGSLKCGIGTCIETLDRRCNDYAAALTVNPIHEMANTICYFNIGYEYALLSSTELLCDCSGGDDCYCWWSPQISAATLTKMGATLKEIQSVIVKKKKQPSVMLAQIDNWLTATCGDLPSNWQLKAWQLSKYTLTTSQNAIKAYWNPTYRSTD